MEPVARQSSGDSQPEKKPTPPKPRSNPFGAARPREEVLKEKEAARSETTSLVGSDKGDAAVSPPQSVSQEAAKDGKTESAAHEESKVEATKEVKTTTTNEDRTEVSEASR